MKTLGIFGLAVLALISLSACTMAVQGQDQQVPGEYIIVPGQRIGNYTLDRTLESYIQELGPDHAVEKNFAGTGVDVYLWPSVTVVTRNNAVIEVYIFTQVFDRRYAAGDPEIVARQRELERYRTPEGLSLGQSVSRVRALYGEPEQIQLVGETERFRMDGFIYGRIGLWVTIESRATPGTVSEIGVFRPGTPRW